MMERERTLLKNGRPYTIGYHGSIDSGLIADESKDIIAMVSEWIQANIRSSRTICGNTSYGLKHLLQHDTGIYLTNNQFKDAMLMAGYSPVDSNDLNWRYRIGVKPPKKDNTSRKSSKYERYL